MPKSVPYTVISASLTSRSVGSPLDSSFDSVSAIRARPSCILPIAWVPPACSRKPQAGSSENSASTSNKLGGAPPAGKVDPCCLTTEPASTTAADEISRAQRSAVGQLGVDARVVLRESRDLVSTIDAHLQFAEPARENALDVV